MGTLSIVESFDVIEDLGAGLGAVLKATSIDELQFECAPEAFHGHRTSKEDLRQQTMWTQPKMLWKIPPTCSSNETRNA